jgi:hypothetical protein
VLAFQDTAALNFKHLLFPSSLLSNNGKMFHITFYNVTVSAITDKSGDTKFVRINKMEITSKKKVFKLLRGSALSAIRYFTHNIVFTGSQL